MTQNYKPLPPAFKKELLRRLSLKEMLVLVHEFGILAICERMNYDDFAQYLKGKI